MADTKSHLNGSYYGPSIPPQHSSQRPDRGRGCGRCILKTLLILFVTVVVLVGLAIFIFWIIVRPTNLKFHVVDASLTQFNLTSDNYLHYDLALNITARNPNKRLGVYYDLVEGKAYYEGQRFATVKIVDFLGPVERFYQRKKTSNTFNPVFKGQNLVLLGADEISDFNSEKNKGVYSIDVKLNMRIRYRLGDFIPGTVKRKGTCDLKVPLETNGTSKGIFRTTRCHVGW